MFRSAFAAAEGYVRRFSSRGPSRNPSEAGDEPQTNVPLHSGPDGQQQHSHMNSEFMSPDITTERDSLSARGSGQTPRPNHITRQPAPTASSSPLRMSSSAPSFMSGQSAPCSLTGSHQGQPWDYYPFPHPASPPASSIGCLDNLNRSASPNPLLHTTTRAARPLQARPTPSPQHPQIGQMRDSVDGQPATTIPRDQMSKHIEGQPARTMPSNLPRLHPIPQRQQPSPTQHQSHTSSFRRPTHPTPLRPCQSEPIHYSDESNVATSDDESFDDSSSLPVHQTPDATQTTHLRLDSDVVAERVCGTLPHSFPALDDDMEAAVVQVRRWAADPTVGDGSHGITKRRDAQSVLVPKRGTKLGSHGRMVRLCCDKQGRHIEKPVSSLQRGRAASKRTGCKWQVLLEEVQDITGIRRCITTLHSCTSSHSHLICVLIHSQGCSP